MLDEGPSQLYDALASILGLDELVAAQERLAEARKTREKAHKDAADMRGQILRGLPQLDDDRARALVDAPRPRRTGASTTRSAIVAQARPATAPRTASSAILRQIASLPCARRRPRSTRAVRALRDAHAGLKATAGTLASRSKDLADVLDQALRFHETHGDGALPGLRHARPRSTREWHEHRRRR